jgi:tetratricopeptide (TPR) repeat protein
MKVKKDLLKRGCRWALLLVLFATACGEDHYQKGQIYLREGRLNQAEQEFQAAIARKPQNAAAYVGLGRVYVEREDYEQALSYLRKALEYDSQSIGAREEMAEIYLRRGQLDLALETCEQAIAITPHWRVYNVLGKVYFQKQEDAKAEDAFKKAIQGSPDHKEAYVNLAGLYIRRGDVNLAEEQYRKFLTVKPEDKEVRLRLGQLYVFQAQSAGAGSDPILEKAAAEFHKAQEIDPKDWIAPTSLGKIYTAQKKYNEAIAAYESALSNAARPQERISAYLELIPLYNQQNQFSKAIEASDKLGSYLKAIQETPENASRLRLWRELMHNHRGRAYLGLGDYINAVGALQDLVNLNPSEAIYHYRLGLAQTGRKNYNEAIASYRRALELSPTLITANLKIASVYIALGDMNNALKECEQALASASPGGEERLDAYYLSGIAYMSLGDHQKSLNHFQKALQLKRDSPKVYIAIGNLYSRQNKLDEARRNYQTALEHDSKSTGAYTGLAEVYALMKDAEKAVQAYKKVIELEPGAPGGYDSLAQYYAASGTNLDEALKLANKAIEIERSPKFRDTLGWVYYKKGMLPEALAELRAASMEAPENPRINYHLGVVAYRDNDINGAYYKVKAAVDSGVAFPEIDEARKLLQEIEAKRQ